MISTLMIRPPGAASVGFIPNILKVGECLEEGWKLSSSCRIDVRRKWSISYHRDCSCSYAMLRGRDSCTLRERSYAIRSGSGESGWMIATPLPGHLIYCVNLARKSSTYAPFCNAWNGWFFRGKRENLMFSLRGSRMETRRRLSWQGCLIVSDKIAMHCRYWYGPKSSYSAVTRQSLAYQSC